jgi:hypothetical protein
LTHASSTDLSLRTDKEKKLALRKKQAFPTHFLKTQFPVDGEAVSCLGAVERRREPSRF